MTWETNTRLLARLVLGEICFPGLYGCLLTVLTWQRETGLQILCCLLRDSGPIQRAYPHDLLPPNVSIMLGVTALTYDFGDTETMLVSLT